MTGTLIVTGGLGALGRVVADVAVRDGWRVVALDHGHHEGDAPDGVRVIGGVDLTDAEATRRAFDRASEDGLDALLNIAGGFAMETASEGDGSAWMRMHAMNVTTALNASRAARAALAASKGAVVNVGAFAALGPAAAGMGPYTASKAGVHKLTESLAAEWAKAGVRVNAVCPSTIDTPANRKAMPKADPSTWVHPEDLAAAMLWLASPASTAVSGALIPVTRARD